jgi:dTDP-4-dehydrorhamnose reductase
MLIVLGGSGFLGPALRVAAGPAGVMLTHCAHPAPGSVFFDARRSSVAQLVDSVGRRPSAALIFFGITNIDACARDPVGTARVNVESVIRVIDELRSLEITPVFTSSDAVFQGDHAWWSEEQLVRPILTYGRQKLEVERHLAAQPGRWLAVRLPKLLSATRNARCMLTGWVEALGRDGTILCATDQYFTPAEAGDASRAILQLIASGASGLFHLGGPERLSRRDLLRAVEQEYVRFAQPRARIKECSLRDIPVTEARPLDLSMDSTRLRTLIGDMLRPASEIARLAVRDVCRSLVV